jgi:hypothetical protein
MITMTLAVAAPILATRLRVEFGGGSVPAYVAPKPRRTQAGVDLHNNSTGVSAGECLLR